MNTHRITTFFFGAIASTVLLASANAQAAATCYLVYDRNDQVVYRDIRSPIDLSGKIGPQINAIWRGGALVIVGAADKCIPLDAADVSAVADAAKPATGTAPDVMKGNAASAPVGEKRSAARAKKSG